jgi:methylmalonyl-CoA/ethylmalonyl-CoA epimerase
MKILKIDHIGIAVPRLDEAASAWRVLGFAVEAVHDVPTEKVRTAFLPVGESHLELLEPTDPTSVLAKFLEKRSGLHHVCVLVDDIDDALRQLQAAASPSSTRSRGPAPEGVAWPSFIPSRPAACFSS